MKHSCRDSGGSRLYPDIGKPRGRLPHQAHRARRHDYRGRLSLASAAPPCRGAGSVAGGGMGAAFHEIQRRPQPGCALSRQGRHIVGTCGRHLAMAETAQRAGFERAIGFDMGGTSTDVSLFTGQYERDNETMVAGARIRAPMLCIHTVAAGGGSICASEDGRLIGGPGSAGAFPGPLLPQWRGIDDHRLQCRDRQGPAAFFPHCSALAGTSRWTPKPLAPVSTPWPQPLASQPEPRRKG